MQLTAKHQEYWQKNLKVTKLHNFNRPVYTK